MQTVLIANMKTGETVSTDTKEGFKQLRGVIRSWMNDGLGIHDLTIQADTKPFFFLRDYAWQHSITTCDVCDHVAKRTEFELVNDSEDVCLAVICKDGAACDKRVNKLIKELEQDDDNFDLYC
jgi:hypothetical protein